MERVPLSNKSGFWFEFSKYIYLLLAFIVRPFLRNSNKLDNPMPISSWEEYYTRRRQIISQGDYSVPKHHFGRFSTYCYTGFSLIMWEKEHHMWWYTTSDEQTINNVKYLNISWARMYRLLYSHCRNRMYEILGIGND